MSQEYRIAVHTRILPCDTPKTHVILTCCPTGEKFVQSSDKATGLPLWVIEVIDPDPGARTRAVKVKIAAQAQPVVPAASPGSPFVPVEFTGLAVTPYVNQAGRLAYSLKAAGIRSPGRGRPGPDTREAAA
jgi:hypothetical protein